MPKTVTVAAMLVALASLAFAQRMAPPSPSPSASPSAPPATRPSARPSPAVSPATPPDIELTATVRWRELRFEEVGTPKVEFSGNPDNETVWRADRENLPTPVQPGVTYRDGGVRLVISSRFRELAAALDGIAASPSPSPSVSPSASPSASPSPR
jgi:hypothetical protein